jgi:SAM-dependent methyltransferase
VSFDRRAATYERGRLGEWHLLVAHRVADVALSLVPAPDRVLVLPFADASFDLVVSAMSFDHWADQELGLAECAPVLLLTRAGFRDPTCRRVYDLGPFPLVQAALTAPSAAHATFASRGD